MGNGPEEQGEKARRLQADEFVERVAPDPSELEPPVVLLTGFLGRSARSGTWRLYLNERLTEYVELAEEDVLESQKLSAQESSLGGTRLWVRRTAQLRHVVVESRDVQAGFLQGEFTAMRGTSAAGFEGMLLRTNLVLTFGPLCPTSNCMTLGPMCPTSNCTLTFGPLCPTSNCMTLGPMCHAP